MCITTALQRTESSLTRAKICNRVKVHRFYVLLDTVYMKNQLSTSNIFNVDDTGIPNVTNKPSRILDVTQETTCFQCSFLQGNVLFRIVLKAPHDFYHLSGLIKKITQFRYLV